ncbi:MAG: hypothetical protein LBT33_03670 [Spirochaetia bacterium]|jgi:hypothetical protein|nr:hypothetical protein [Spirochaetia bacterium]
MLNGKSGLFPCLVFFMCVAGCSIDYREGQIAEELEDQLPNIRMVNLRHRVATKDRLIMEMRVRRSESYEAAKKIVLFGVDFHEYGQSGEVTAEGKADMVVYHTDTKNAEIEGNIDIVSHKEEGGIRTQHLYWNDERRFLSASPDEVTEIFDEDGSLFSGRGFEADIKRLIISFLEGVDGNFVTAGEGEETGEEAGTTDGTDGTDGTEE